MLISLLAYFLLLILGACVGSFLNVLIDRLPKGRTLWGRSQSDCCRRQLDLWDLLPILSFIFWRGRCRHCRQKISGYYPAVEFLAGLAAVFALITFPFPASLYLLANFYFLMVFFFTDLKYGLAPLVLVFIQGGLVLLYNLIFVGAFFVALGSAAVAALFIVFLILMTKGRGMGWGDVWIVFVYGFFLGFPKNLVMIFLSFFLGGFLGALLLLMKRKRLGQSLPFIPFLSLAALIAFFYGERLLDAYLRLVLK